MHVWGITLNGFARNQFPIDAKRTKAPNFVPDINLYVGFC